MKNIYKKIFRSGGVRLLTIASLFFMSICAHADTPQVMMRAQLSANNVYSHGCVTLDICLYSEIRDISYVRPVKFPEIVYLTKQLTADTLSRRCEIIQINPDNTMVTREKVGKSEYFKFIVGRYVIIPLAEGQIGVTPSEYEIGVNQQKVVYDPFWGEVSGYETVPVRCVTKELKFKSTRLPNYNVTGYFSGCVGDFSVTSYLPPGDIIKDKEATVVIEIEGDGYLPDDCLPELRKAFGQGMRLKSVSENRQFRYGESGLRTMMEFVCRFVPENDEVKIGSVSFTFFDPVKKRYVTVKSEGLSEEVTKKGTKSPSDSELMEI